MSISEQHQSFPGISFHTDKKSKTSVISCVDPTRMPRRVTLNMVTQKSNDVPHRDVCLGGLCKSHNWYGCLGASLQKWGRDRGLQCQMCKFLSSLWADCISPLQTLMKFRLSL